MGLFWAYFLVTHTFRFSRDIFYLLENPNIVSVRSCYGDLYLPFSIIVRNAHEVIQVTLLHL